jgi:hypothetical protein
LYIYTGYVITLRLGTLMRINQSINQLIGNSPISGAALGFPALDDADFFPGPPLSYFLQEVDEGWLVMALALGLGSLLGKNPHS